MLYGIWIRGRLLSIVIEYTQHYAAERIDPFPFPVPLRLKFERKIAPRNCMLPLPLTYTPLNGSIMYFFLAPVGLQKLLMELGFIVLGT